MSKVPLIVTVTEPATGASWDYVFEASPVMVGRGEGAQLRLDRGFVSLQHGTFDFDDAGVTYVDLDSRNGTLIDGVARASDRPVPLSETTDVRIGGLRLRVTRVVAKEVGEEGQSPFAPKAGKGVVKGTDALPREELERIRRELVARKEPAAAPVVPVVPVVPAVPVVPLAASTPSEPLLEKTVAVPALTSRELPEVGGPMAPAARYTPGETRAVPTPPRRSEPRAAVRPSRPRPAERQPRRAVVAPPRRGVPWLPIGIGVVVAAVATVVLLMSGGRERTLPPDEPPVVEPKGDEPPVKAPVVEAPVVVEPPVVKAPAVLHPKEVSPQVHHPTKRKGPEPKETPAPAPQKGASKNGSPILQ